MSVENEKAIEFYKKGNVFEANLLAMTKDLKESFTVASVTVHALNEEQAMPLLMEILELTLNSRSTEQAFPDHLFHKVMIKTYP